MAENEYVKIGGVVKKKSQKGIDYWQVDLDMAELIQHEKPCIQVWPNRLKDKSWKWDYTISIVMPKENKNMNEQSENESFELNTDDGLGKPHNDDIPF